MNKMLVKSCYFENFSHFSQLIWYSIYDSKSVFQQLYLNFCFTFPWEWLRARRFTEQLIERFSGGQRSLTCHHCRLPLVPELHLEGALDSSKTRRETTAGTGVLLAVKSLNKPYLEVRFLLPMAFFAIPGRRVRIWLGRSGWRGWRSHSRDDSLGKVRAPARACRDRRWFTGWVRAAERRRRCEAPGSPQPLQPCPRLSLNAVLSAGGMRI